MKIKKNDTVLILTGKDAKKTGAVLRVLPKTNAVVVENVNLATRHLKPRRQGQKGEKILLAKPLPVSKVMLICPKCKKPTRVGFTKSGDEKLRLCKQCEKTFN